MYSGGSKIINHLHSSENRWFAVYTKYKCEKFVVDTLIKKGIKAYIPLIKTTKRYSRKIKTYNVPLINCYVFVNITKEEYLKVLHTEYVFKFVKQREELLAIPNEEIQLLKKIVGDSKGNPIVLDNGFETGQKVEIISGSLTGLKGKLIGKKNKREILVELYHLGIFLKISINIGQVRPINNLVEA